MIFSQIGGNYNMAKISQVRRCYNCGAILQSDDPSKEGYINKETYENAQQNFMFCEKCFEIERFHGSTNEPFISEDYLYFLNDAKKKNALIVYVVNLFSFEASFSSTVNEIIKDMDILVVGNKFDLLPKDVRESDIEEYVAHRFRASGLKITRDQVALATVDDDETAKSILSLIYEKRAGRNVYVIGTQSSGKSTLVNSFLRVYSNMSNGNIVTHNYPHTKLQVMEIPLSSKTSLYDAPGMSATNSILNEIDSASLKSIYLTKSVEPREISLSEGHALFIGGLAIIELVEGKKTTLTMYFNDKIQFKKMGGAHFQERFVQLVNRKLLTPSLSRIKSVHNLDCYEIKITESNLRDIGIQGLGWFTFEAKGQTLRVYVPKGTSIYNSRPKIIVD